MIYEHSIDPAILRIGGLEIRWYGLFYLVGFFIAYIFVKKNFKYRGVKLSRQQYDSLLFNIMLGLIVGARVGYMIFYNLGYYVSNPLHVFAFWHGGMSFHGGAIGVLVAGLLTLRKVKVNFWAIADTFMPYIAFGLGLGRIGNFINGELYGRETGGNWGVIFPEARDNLLRHPSQLYQAFTEGFLMFALLQFLLIKKKKEGIVFWSFFILYSVFRFFTEFFREPDSHIGFVAGFLTMGQILNIGLLLISLTIIIFIYRKNETKTV